MEWQAEPSKTGNAEWQEWRTKTLGAYNGPFTNHFRHGIWQRCSLGLICLKLTLLHFQRSTKISSKKHWLVTCQKFSRNHEISVMETAEKLLFKSLPKFLLSLIILILMIFRLSTISLGIIILSVPKLCLAPSSMALLNGHLKKISKNCEIWFPES